MSNCTTQYLTDPRKNRNSGAKVSASMKDKVETVEYREVYTKEYQGKILCYIQDNIRKCE